jgi:hypothetical protein
VQRSKAAAVNEQLRDLRHRASLEEGSSVHGDLATVVVELIDVVHELVKDSLRVERNSLGGAADLRERPRSGLSGARLREAPDPGSAA